MLPSTLSSFLTDLSGTAGIGNYGHSPRRAVIHRKAEDLQHNDYERVRAWQWIELRTSVLRVPLLHVTKSLSEKFYGYVLII